MVSEVVLRCSYKNPKLHLASEAVHTHETSTEQAPRTTAAISTPLLAPNTDPPRLQNAKTHLFALFFPQTLLSTEKQRALHSRGFGACSQGKTAACFATHASQVAVSGQSRASDRECTDTRGRRRLSLA